MFRDLITCLSASLGVLLPRATATLRKWIIDEYEEQKECLKKRLAGSRSRIHVSFDIWTSMLGQFASLKLHLK